MQAVHECGDPAHLTGRLSCHKVFWCNEYSALIAWDDPCAGVEDLSIIASCIGGAGLAIVCQLLAEDHSGWSGEISCLMPIQVEAS